MTPLGIEYAQSPAGTGALREFRERMIRLLKEPNEALCVECIATVLGQRVSVVMMTMLGLHARVASVEGVCSACHRRARVIMSSARPDAPL